jgi:hypothetical protein
MQGKERDFLNDYFISTYNKLEADAMIYNRKLPHSGMIGTENEKALVELLEDFLPSKYGIENSGIVIDKYGNASKQCDIIIYDSSTFPKYFKKVFPVELVYGVIEVKTCLTSSEAKIAKKNLQSVNELDFRPELTPYWKTMTKKRRLFTNPPFGMIFSYRTITDCFDTFANWFRFQDVHNGINLESGVRTMTIVSLDQGYIKMETSNGYIERCIPNITDDSTTRGFHTKVKSYDVKVDPAKTLFVALETLWQQLNHQKIHPGFDIRSYLSYDMGHMVDATKILNNN